MHSDRSRGIAVRIIGGRIILCSQAGLPYLHGHAGPTWMLCRQSAYAVFRIRQIGVAPVHLDLPHLKVHVQGAEMQEQAPAPTALRQSCPDLGSKFSNAERLAYVVVGTQAISQDCAVLVSLGRQEDDRAGYPFPMEVKRAKPSKCGIMTSQRIRSTEDRSMLTTFRDSLTTVTT